MSIEETTEGSLAVTKDEETGTYFEIDYERETIRGYTTVTPDRAAFIMQITLEVHAMADGSRFRELTREDGEVSLSFTITDGVIRYHANGPLHPTLWALGFLAAVAETCD